MIFITQLVQEQAGVEKHILRATRKSVFNLLSQIGLNNPVQKLLVFDAMIECRLDELADVFLVSFGGDCN